MQQLKEHFQEAIRPLLLHCSLHLLNPWEMFFSTEDPSFSGVPPFCHQAKNAAAAQVVTTVL